MDSVGPPLKNVEVRIAEDGEILVRGELVMHGYWRNEADTARALQGGWLHTGDIGEIDTGGRLRITDRKKDIIVNDKGENVAPQRIEGMLTLQPEIGQTMVHGDKRPHLVALIVPDPEYFLSWGDRPQDNPAFLPTLRAAVDRVNADLSVTEKIRRFAVADEPFSVENGEMTPSLKIRRHVIRDRYLERLEKLYGG
jgi:long-chain acyl-CoA synthetase